ncbi:MAG: hydrophobe/amphiphile efflux-3 (HAE3) family transporter [Clostridia bacterium]
MVKLFSKLGKIIDSSPIKVLLLTLLVFGIMFVGARDISFSTGNETIVEVDNPIYINNQQMEETFGSESILVLFEGEQDQLLSVDNIREYWEIEQEFNNDENIFYIISPATIINQISDIQSETIKENLLEMSQGLNEAGSNLIMMGEELNSQELMDPKIIEEKLNSLSGISTNFDNLIKGQNNLSDGITSLGSGLDQSSIGILEASNKLNSLSQTLPDDNQLKIQLSTLAENLAKSSSGIGAMSDNTAKLDQGATQTAQALENIKNNLQTETSLLKSQVQVDFDPQKIKEMAAGLIEVGNNLNNISQGLETFYEKSQMMIADIPTTQSEINEILYSDGKLRAAFSEVMIDENHSLMVFKLNGNISDSVKDSLVEDIRVSIANSNFSNLDYTISGKPVLDTALRTEMQNNMQMMVIAAVAIMLIILTLIFKVRWRILSLGIILVSVIATLGLMGWINVPITMVSMAVFPILIGLGIDYSIQFHNRYEEEQSVSKTIKHIGKAVAVAVIATFLGFISLYASPVPMIQDFGKMLTIGVIISFIGSVFILMSILKLRDSTYTKIDANKNTGYKEGFIERALSNITKGVIKGSVVIFIFAIIIAGFGFSFDSSIGVESNIENFMPQDMEALTDIRHIRDTVGSTEQVVLFFEGDNILDDENILWIENTQDELTRKYHNIIVDTKSIMTPVDSMSMFDSDQSFREKVENLPPSQRKMFINEESTKSNLILEIKYLPTEDLEEFIVSLKNDLVGAPMKVSLTGKSVLDVEMVDGLTSGRIEMTLIGLGLVFLALLVIYRSLFKAIIPLIPVALIIGMSSGTMYLLGLSYTPITATLGALILGMGTEMTVMVMERYVEERKNGYSKKDAMIIAISRIGKAILASGLTTMGGFSVLIFSEFVILKDFGMMTVINIFLALLSTFIILPAVIYLFDGLLLTKREKRIVLREAEDSTLD